MQLSGAEPLIVLIQRRNLVVKNHVLQDLAVYVVALQGLAELAPAEDVATAGKPFVNHTDPWSVLVVSESEAKFDLLAAGHKHLDEEVQVGLVERYENDLVVLRYELFDHFDGLGIDPESLNVHPHIFVEIPEEEGVKSSILELNIFTNSAVFAVCIAWATRELSFAAFKAFEPIKAIAMIIKLFTI